MSQNSDIKISGSKKRFLLLTFDYELFLGTNSGSAQKCIIEPTEYILDILKANSIRNAIFFVDTTYLQKLIDSTSEASKTDLAVIYRQLISLIKEEHYVFPHIHPHWKDAVYDSKTNTWNLEQDRFYRFHSLSQKEKDFLFKNAISIIDQLQKKAGRSYPIDAYRAGGWCIQPFADFKPYFEKYGIIFDFSVLRGHGEPNENNFYNFATVPQKVIYKFSNEVNSEDDQTGKFYEFTISSLEKTTGLNTFFERLYNKYLWLTENRSIGDGFSLAKNTGRKTETETEMASLELLTMMKLNRYERFLKNENYFQIISHPKMLSKHNLKMFQRFIRSARKKYDLVTDYKLMLN